MLNPFNHVDIRVDCMSEALPFYQCLLGAMRFIGPEELPEEQGVWQVFRAALQQPVSQYIGLLEDESHRANSNRIAFHVATKSQVDRVAAVLRQSGVTIEGPSTCPEYGTSYYAAFFEDPSGNRLELCCLRDDERSRSGHFGIDQILATLDLPDIYTIRAWRSEDFDSVRVLSNLEGWTTPDLRPEETMIAWERSWPALVVVHDSEVIGFLRSISDFEVSTYLGEILVSTPHRGRGLGKALITVCHGLVPRTRIDLLSVSGADAFYEALGGNSLAGFRLPSQIV